MSCTLIIESPSLEIPGLSAHFLTGLSRLKYESETLSIFQQTKNKTLILMHLSLGILYYFMFYFESNSYNDLFAHFFPLFLFSHIWLNYFIKKP